MKSKILVTGGAGFIGSHLTDELIKRGHGVLVVDNLSTGKLKNINKKAKFLKLDLSSSSAIKTLTSTLKGIDYVFHLATIPRIHFCIENPSEAHKSNVNGTLNLLEACAKNSQIKKFILASSCMVYGDFGSLFISEAMPANPLTTYGVHKYMQELYTNMFTKFNALPSVILRYFAVYGTRRHSEGGSYPNVAAAFLRDSREKNKISIYGDGEQSRDMVHVFDIVRATIMAMESKFHSGEVFNVCTGKPTTIKKIASYYNCPIEYKPTRLGDIRHFTGDNKKAKKLLKWQPKISFDEGIKAYISNKI